MLGSLPAPGRPPGVAARSVDAGLWVLITCDGIVLRPGGSARRWQGFWATQKSFAQLKRCTQTTPESHMELSCSFLDDSMAGRPMPAHGPNLCIPRSCHLHIKPAKAVNNDF